jgi:hypothetical protein
MVKCACFGNPVKGNYTKSHKIGDPGDARSILCAAEAYGPAQGLSDSSQSKAYVVMILYALLVGCPDDDGVFRAGADPQFHDHRPH